MRIALATDWWPPRTGGVESQSFDLAAVLASRGHDVHVLTTTRTPTALPSACVEHVDVPMVGGIAAPDLRRVSLFADRLAAVEPDVVHAHGMFSTCAIGAVLAADRLRLPSVFTVHSLLRPVPVFAAASAVFRVFANRATVVTAVSAATAADVRAASGRDVVAIPNGLMLSDWRAVRTGGDGIRMVAVTRLAPKKQPIDLVRALAETVRRVRGPVTMDIAGDGPERAGLEREARRLGVGGRLTFHGACTRAAVRDLLARASLFVHAGRREAFGLAVLEARAAGLPVVAMASGGVPELVEHGTHGLLADSRGAFADCAATLAGDSALRARCAANAPRDLETYDWSSVAGRHEAAYALAIERLHTSGRHAKNSMAAAT